MSEEEAYIEILDTNKELRKELASEIVTNDISNKKLNSLSRELDTCYKIISRQDSTIIAHENEIESLKSEIISLKQCLRKGLQDIKQKEKQLLSREDQLQELENRVDCLKKRIKELVDKKITINISNMAHPIRKIFDNRLIIANNIASIRRQLDNSGIQIPQDITGHFNNIADSLNEINQTTAIIQNFCQNQVTQLDQQTRRAIVAKQNLANVIVERNNFQTTLHDYQDMVAELTKDLTKANNDILHRDRLLEEGLQDEREVHRR
jgi:chromosome segregation ATPase